MALDGEIVLLEINYQNKHISWGLCQGYILYWTSVRSSTKTCTFNAFNRLKLFFFLTSTVASFINEIISIPGCNNRNPKKVLILFLIIEDKTWGKQKQQLIHQFILKNKSLFLPNLALFYEWSFPIYFQVMCFLDCTTNTWLNCSLKNKIIFPCNDWN